MYAPNKSETSAWCSMNGDVTTDMPDITDANFQWVIFKTEHGCYLFNRASGKFLYKDGSGTVFTDVPQGYNFQLLPSTGAHADTHPTVLAFGSYQVTADDGVRNAVRIMKETGCDGMKIEGGAEIADMIRRIVGAGIPVVGHLGLTPQSVNVFGGYGLRAKEEAEAAKLLADAHALEEAGCCAVTLEKVPAALATQVSRELTVPTIGIGAGNGCDGQVLVVHDMLGMNKGFKPKFLRHYAQLHDTITDAVGQYVGDVKTGDFPNDNESY